jgi:hypothetical protein
MKTFLRHLPLILLATAALAADQPPADWIAAAEKRREEIPPGGDFKPQPKVPTFVAVGHGARIVVSKDDGKTWTQAFWGYPGADHGLWATKSVAYAGGVFVVPVGWGAPTIYLASDDAVHWRHLTRGTAQLPEGKGDARVMPGTWDIAGGKGTFVAGGYMTMAATRDFGQTFDTFSLYRFKDDPRPRKLVTHHVGPVYCGDKSGRFLALGNDRSTENTVFGNLFASDDLGKTWTWLEPELLNAKCDGYSGIVSNGDLVLIADKDGSNVFRSADAGQTWEGPFVTGTKRVTLSVVKGEFWLTGDVSRSSADGQTWGDLPKAVPSGKVVASDTGTLVSIDARRFNILRSADGGKSWAEVFTFKPETEYVHGAQGLRDIAFGLVNAN